MFERFFLGFLGLTFSLHALPSGGQVVGGEAALTPSSDTLQVNANGKAILQWEQFNIASHEAVHFVQAQSGQAILNRVASDSVTQILGQLRANCPIYLINPHGIFIGNGACIDTAGFLASTADLSNEAFWHGSELLFQDFGDGKIVNLGALRASEGDVFLIARAIDNQGTIEAPHGNVILATHEVMLRPDTKECVFIRVDEADPEDIGIKNSGKITALEVELSTHSPYEKAICHTGSIEASASLEQNGRIYLVADHGETFVDGSLTARSGDVRVLGQKILVEEHAYIDVSGSSGGTVLIGGDYQGANLDILNAEETLVLPGAQIHADALLQGNGGKVIVWSDKATFFYGKISVRGGEQGGNGGFAEVSGKRLEYRGFTDATAKKGKIGELLLDPNDVIIGAMNVGAGTFSACVPPVSYNFDNATATNQILNTDLQTQLASCNVTIDTSSGSASGGAGPNNGSVTVSSAVTWSANTTLTLTAKSFMVISASITNTSATTGFTAVNMTANGVGATTNPGILLSAGTITTTGGDVMLNGTSAAVANTGVGVRLNGGSIATGSGNIFVTGHVPVGATIGTQGIFISAGSVTSTSGLITFTGTINSSSPSNGFVNTIPLNFLTTGTVTFSNCISTSNGSGVAINGNLTLAGDLVFSNCQGGAAGLFLNRSISSTGNITANQVIATGSGGNGYFSSGGTISTSGAGKAISITGSSTGTTGTCRGIFLSGSLSAVGAGSSITLNGTSGASNSASYGIDFSGGTITTGTGNISVTGLVPVGTTGANSYGISLTGVSSLILSGDGLISVTGNGGGSGSNAGGIGVFASAKIQATGSGSVTLTGTASSTGGNSSRGIVVNGTGSVVSSNSGTVTLNGTGGGTGTSSSGLEVSAGGKISSTSGLITGTFMGAAGTIGCTGIFVTGSPSLITTATGSGINLTGIGNGTTTSNQGISLAAGGRITTTNNAPITLVGTGSASGTSSNDGIFVTGSLTQVSTATGAIQMTGTAGGGTTNGITVDTSASVFSATAGLVTLTSTNNNVSVSNHGSVQTQGVGGPGINDILITSNGLSVTGGAAGGSIVSTVNGNITVPSTGPISVTGSTAGNSFGQITVGNAVNTITLQSVGLTMTGGSGSGAFAEISTNGGALTIDGTTTSSGAISLTGGSNANTYAQIITKTTGQTTATDMIIIGQTVGQIRPTSITLQGGSDAAASLSRAVIATDQGGNILCTITGNYNITGGTSTGTLTNGGRAGFYTGLTVGSGNITLTGGAYSLTGGLSGLGTNPAEILTPATGGAISLTSNGSSVTLLARGAAVSDARIMSLASSDLSINNISTFSATGGAGATARAIVATDQGGSITITGSGNYTVHGGTSGTDSRAGIYAGFSAGSGNITLGGAAYSLTGGASGAGYNSAEILTPAGGGNIQLTYTTSNPLLQGGGAAISNARIITLGTGNITVTGSGNFSALGGSGASSDADVNAQGTLTINTGSGNYILTGGSGASSLARFTATGAVNVTGSNYTLTAGSNTTANASNSLIQSTGVNGSVTVTANNTGIVTLNGGTAAGQHSYIQTTAGSGTNPVSVTCKTLSLNGSTTATATNASAEILSSFGSISVIANGQITLTGGSQSGATARAAISAGNTTHTIGIQMQGLTMTGGSAATALAEIASLGGAISIDGTTTSSGAILLNAVAADAIIHTTTNALTTANDVILIGQTVGHVLPTTITMNGSAARAIISTDVGGNIKSTISGNYSATGGTGATDSRAGFYTGLTSGAGNITLTGAAYSLTGGASGAGYNSAEILTPTAGGLINLTSNGSPVSLQAGATTTSDARIESLASGALNINSISTFTASGGSGATSRAIIATGQGGDINVTGNGNYTITGGTSGTDSRAGFYAGLAAGSGNITLSGAAYSLTGGLSGAGYNSAEILAPTGGGLITINSNGSPLSLHAGAATISDARIESLASGNLIINNISTFTASGNSGDSSRAIVATGQGGDINVTGLGHYSITGGTSGTDSRAGFYAGLAAGSGNIILSGTGFSLTGGSSGAGYNSAEILTPVGGGSISLTSGATAIQLQGGGGTTSDARIITLGSGNINITGSSAFSAVGGSGASSVADVNAQGTLISNIGTGIYTLTGGSGTSSLARFTATGAVNLNGHDYNLTAGNSLAADGSNAVIQSTGMNTTLTLTANNGGAVTLNGGTAADQHSYIETTAGVGTNPITLSCGSLSLNGSMTGGATQASAEVRTILGNIQISASGNVTLTGGSAINTNALIQSTMQGALTVSAQNLNIQGGIGAGISGIVTQAGDISITCSQNAQCTAPNAGGIAAIQTFGSDLTMAVGGSIDLSGFTILSTPAPTGNLLLIAGQNISIGNSVQIIDNGTVNSTLTLVVDNAFPTAPGVGPGQFILDAGGTISAGAGTPVKIYTAQRPQNTILSPINGMPYVPGPFAVDTPTEQWGIYYPSGVYGGVAFTIYYKEPQPLPPPPPPNPQHQIYINIAANVVQLSDLLPVFLPVLDVSRGHYHFQVCDEVNGFECAPTFSPYGSFIFQDDIYWIGTDFFRTNGSLVTTH